MQCKGNLTCILLIRKIYLSYNSLSDVVSHSLSHYLVRYEALALHDQADGLFIGSPASPAYAELFVQRIEEHHVYQMIHAPRIWLRKVDDTFTISPQLLTLLQRRRLTEKYHSWTAWSKGQQITN